MEYFFAFAFVVWYLYRRGVERDKWGGFVMVVLLLAAAMISAAFD